MHQFWGGHYKIFAVNGPGKFLFRIGRNYSFNTILSAVLIDRLTGEHQGLNARLYAMPMPWMGNLFYDPPGEPEQSALSQELGELASLFQASVSARSSADGLALSCPIDLQVHRAAMALGASDELLSRWRWKLRLWTPDDREAFVRMMHDAWEGMKKMNPGME